MPILKCYLITLFLLVPALSFAQLPNDADRSVDVELAGFLYSQGVYKSRTGSFVALSQARDSEQKERLARPVHFPGTDSNSKRIDSWIRSTDAKVSFKELINQ